MKQKNTSYNWQLSGDCIKGSKHIINGLPNQDAYRWQKKGSNLAVAVSDGHGGLKHFRSQIGAKLAVEAAIEVLFTEAVISDFDPANIPKIKCRVAEKLPLRIVNHWQEKIKEYHAKNPFTNDDFAQKKLAEIEKKQGLKVRKYLETAPKGYLKAYGATLLASLVNQDFGLTLQLGDGDILAMKSDGSVERLFSNSQFEKFDNSTESLCMSNPEAYFEINLTSFTKKSAPLLYLLATDGYADSFYDEAGFFKTVYDISNLIEQKGIKYIENNLKTWLEETSKQGSGDDITLVFIYQQQLINSTIKELSNEVRK